MVAMLNSWIGSLVNFVIGIWMYIYNSWCEMFDHLTALFTSGAFATFCFASALVVFMFNLFIFQMGRGCGSRFEELLGIIFFALILTGGIAVGGYSIKFFFC